MYPINKPLIPTILLVGGFITQYIFQLGAIQKPRGQENLIKPPRPPLRGQPWSFRLNPLPPVSVPQTHK